MTACILCLVGLSFTKACAASKSPKQNKASVEDNLKQFLSIYKKDQETKTDDPQAKRFLSSLDQESRLQISRKLLKETDGRIVYIGASILIRDGYMDETIPSLADLITSGRDETDLNGRFGYEWVHSSDKYLFGRIITRIFRYFIRNWTNYTDGERALAYRLMSPLLQLDSQSTYSVEAAEKALQKLETGLPENKK
jgi:hypothetical protein